ncbi:MAG: hypothetical protein J6Z22_01895 [Lachnospiraceae bacterium]|nr:hypothetical protein [Lachnospiraceae bacterium]
MMDFQKFVDCIEPMTCVISVEKNPDGSYGTIRIVTGNKAYIDSIENTDDGPKMLVNKFIPNSEYQTYFPKDLNFEDFCYRAAILKQPLHTYVHPERFDFWFNIFMMPLASDDENMGYCTYTQEISHEANVSKMTQLSYETASDVLNTCIKLRGAEDFEHTVKEVISDVREICRARHCCLLQFDLNNRKCRVLADSFADGYVRKTMVHWEDDEHFELVLHWQELIAGSNCLIIKNEHEMEFIKERNPVWHGSLVKAGVDSIVLFPLKARWDLLGYIWETNFAVEDTLRIK